MPKFYHPVTDLPPAYYAAIGEFLFRFAQLEYQMHEVVWAALGLGYKAGRTLTIGTDIKVLCGMLGTIASTRIWVKDASHIQRINSLAGDARKHINLRNSIAHGSWQSLDGGPKDAHLHFMKDKEQRILPRIDPTLDDRKIRARSAHLRALNLRAKKLISELMGARTSSQQKSA